VRDRGTDTAVMFGAPAVVAMVEQFNWHGFWSTTVLFFTALLLILRCLDWVAKRFAVWWGNPGWRGWGGRKLLARRDGDETEQFIRGD